MDYKEIYHNLKEDLRTTTGRNVLTFLVFFLVAAAFWVLQALNDEVQKDFRVPLTLEDFPRNMTIISGNVPTLNVIVKDKGSALSKFAWGNNPSLTISYEDFTHHTDNYLLLSEAQLNSALHSLFGSSASIVSVRPDSLHLAYTTNPGIPVRVHIDADVATQPQYEVFGAMTLSQDTVHLYSNLKSRLKIKELNTVPITLTELSDTTVVEARIDVPEGMRAIPQTVRVTIPVEPLVSKTRKLRVEAINVPRDMTLLTFPQTVEVTYLMPKSLYSAQQTPLRAVVDYHDITSGVKNLPVKLHGIPSYYKSAQLATPSVEFLLERK